MIPDGKTVVGRDSSDDKKLVAEDITSNAVTQIGTLSSSIYTVLYEPKSRSLFAGDEHGHLHQYHKAEDITSFALVKDHGDIGFGELQSSALVGDLAIFGGTDSCLAALDIPKKELLSGSFKTAFRDIYSLQVCQMSKSRALLSVGGTSPSYSNWVSDIFEVQTREELPASTFSTQTESSESTPALVSDPVIPDPQYSKKMVRTLLSDVFAYVDILLRNFTCHYEARLQQTRGRPKLSFSNPSRLIGTRSRFRLRTLGKGPENY